MARVAAGFLRLPLFGALRPGVWGEVAGLAVVVGGDDDTARGASAVCAWSTRDGMSP